MSLSTFAMSSQLAPGTNSGFDDMELDPGTQALSQSPLYESSNGDNTTVTSCLPCNDFGAVQGTSTSNSNLEAIIAGDDLMASSNHLASQIYDTNFTDFDFENAFDYASYDAFTESSLEAQNAELSFLIQGKTEDLATLLKDHAEALKTITQKDLVIQGFATKLAAFEKNIQELETRNQTLHRDNQILNTKSKKLHAAYIQCKAAYDRIKSLLGTKVEPMVQERMRAYRESLRKEQAEADELHKAQAQNYINEEITKAKAALQQMQDNHDANIRHREEQVRNEMQKAHDLARKEADDNHANFIALTTSHHSEYRKSVFAINNDLHKQIRKLTKQLNTAKTSEASTRDIIESAGQAIPQQKQIQPGHLKDNDPHQPPTTAPHPLSSTEFRQQETRVNLYPAQRITSKVQIRPEHLAPAYAQSEYSGQHEGLSQSQIPVRCSSQAPNQLLANNYDQTQFQDPSTPQVVARSLAATQDHFPVRFQAQMQSLASPNFQVASPFDSPAPAQGLTHHLVLAQPQSQELHQDANQHPLTSRDQTPLQFQGIGQVHNVWTGQDTPQSNVPVQCDASRQYINYYSNNQSSLAIQNPVDVPPQALNCFDLTTDDHSPNNATAPSATGSTPLTTSTPPTDVSDHSPHSSHTASNAQAGIAAPLVAANKKRTNPSWLESHDNMRVPKRQKPVQGFPHDFSQALDMAAPLPPKKHFANRVAMRNKDRQADRNKVERDRKRAEAAKEKDAERDRKRAEERREKAEKAEKAEKEKEKEKELHKKPTVKATAAEARANKVDDDKTKRVMAAREKAEEKRLKLVRKQIKALNKSIAAHGNKSSNPTTSSKPNEPSEEELRAIARAEKDLRKQEALDLELFGWGATENEFPGFEGDEEGEEEGGGEGEDDDDDLAADLQAVFAEEDAAVQALAQTAQMAQTAQTAQAAQTAPTYDDESSEESEEE